jgi:uncharacterized protein involved in response to NO
MQTAINTLIQVIDCQALAPYLTHTSFLTPISQESIMSPRIPIGIDEPGGSYTGPLLLAAGHRPFFLLAALYATAGIAFWLAALNGYVGLPPSWHGHEMIFGFGTASLSGFMMAAVPKWTNSKATQGTPLAILVALWLLGRGAVLSDNLAWLDLLHLPFLAFLVGRMIFGAGNKRNYIVPVMLLVLALINALYHFGDSSLALRAAAILMTGFIALIGGRVVPAFTQNALRMATSKPVNCTTPAWTERLVLPLIFLVTGLELLWPETPYSGTAALVTAAVLLVRMSGWQTGMTFSIPLVWILHAGFFWLPLGFALKGLGDLGVLDDTTAAMHAMTAGAVGVMVLAMGSRAALGHSGRPLHATPMTVVTYVLILAAVILRVFIPLDWAIPAAGVLWTIGWGMFSIVYWPVLAKPRIDGLPY